MALATLAVLGGTGRQGRGIALRYARAGHRVIVGSRDPGRAAETMSRWPKWAKTIEAATYHDAIAAAEVILVVMPFDAVDAMLASNRGAFTPGSLIVDVTVPVQVQEGGGLGLARLPEGSAAEFIRARAPQQVQVGLAFKTLPARLLADVDQPLACDEFICGDSDDTRARITKLVEQLDGLRAVDLGPLTNARSVEHFALTAIAVNRRYKIQAARFRVVGL